MDGRCSCLLACTDWDLFFNLGDNFEQSLTVIPDYSVFCEDMIIPKKPI